MAFCSVCLDAMVEGEGRSTARLTCGHSFHLDCIGSAFNAKGKMQCPNCRGVEQGRWLYANSCCLKEDFYEDSSFEQETEVYSTAGESQFNHAPWCPHQGSYEHFSLTFEELMNFGNGYVDPLQSSLHGRRVCPYLVGVHNVPRQSNHTENIMALRLYNFDRSVSGSGPQGASHSHQGRLAVSAHNGSWAPYRGSSRTYNQTGPNLHPNHRHLMFGFLLESPQSAERFNEGTDAGGQHVHNQVGQMRHRRSHPNAVSLVRNGQTNNRLARNGEVFRTTTSSHNYHIQRAQMSEPIHGHPSWGGPYSSQQRPSVAPYGNGVHWAAVGPHISYGMPVYWWAWAPFETNHRSMVPYSIRGAQSGSTFRTAL